MKLSKNKKNEKNKNRFVFLSFLPETDAFSTRHRLEVQRPCFENFLTDLRELRSDNQDVPPAQVQQVRHEAGEVGEGCLRLQQRTADVLSCPVQVPTSCCSSEAPLVAPWQHLPSLRQYIFPVAKVFDDHKIKPLAITTL
jgi:hypothetical protein